MKIIQLTLENDSVKDLYLNVNHIASFAVTPNKEKNNTVVITMNNGNSYTFSSMSNEIITNIIDLINYS